jgi:hypothetical protein
MKAKPRKLRSAGEPENTSWTDGSLLVVNELKNHGTLNRRMGIGGSR